ncbi:MAG: LTA synthase family protein [Coprococcus sp.]|nr:LTA synthase family protein [Coprococcus sp.]
MFGIVGGMYNDVRVYFKKWSGWIMFSAIILYYELIFHGLNFDMKIKDVSLIIIFAIVFGGAFGLLTGIFPRLVNKIIATVLLLATGLIFTAQYIYHSVFNNYLSIAGTIKFGNQAADNAATVMSNVKENMFDIVLLVLPVVVGIVFIWAFMAFDRRKWWANLIAFAGVLLVYGTTLFVLWAVSSDVYSPYNVYKQYTSVDIAVEKLGVMESFVVDIREGVFSGENKSDEIQFASIGDIEEDTEATTVATTESVELTGSVEETTEEEVIDISPNILDLDFDAINELSGSDAVSSLSSYFKTIIPTKKNEYTGMFEGYNVIWITAEGFTGYMLDSRLFPTLSKLAYEGFVFENYYQPLWYGSTLGGEYANLMGSPTKNGAYLSMCRAADNENGMYFSMANTLGRLGYSCYGFHDNDYTYYDRHITHPALGYEWIASDQGLEYQTDEYGNDLWPQSDSVMLEETFDTYSAKVPFHLYYLTVSGHVPYGFGGANDMSDRNIDVVSGLNYSDLTNAYLASQYELELMVQSLLEKLEKRNILDRTVIVLAGDHVPYDNMEIVDELAGQYFEQSLEAYKSKLIIWSGSMEESVRVDKVCSSIDILPTMLNLMGAEYDSRLIIGRDILSTSPGLVLFPNRSYITDDYEYNAYTGDTYFKNGTEVTDEDISRMERYVSDKFTAADNITETGYYTYVARYIEEKKKD